MLEIKSRVPTSRALKQLHPQPVEHKLMRVASKLMIHRNHESYKLIMIFKVIKPWSDLLFTIRQLISCLQH